MKIISIIVITFFPFVLIAQAKTNSELKNLITQSFTYFSKVKEAENAITTAQEKIELAKLNVLPSIDASGNYTYLAPVSKVIFPMNGVNTPLQFQPNHNYSVGVNGNYVIYDFGRQKATIEKSKTELQFAKDNGDFVKGQLANQVAVIYYNIVYLQKAISIQDSVLNYLTENKKIVQSKLNNGDALKIDILNIQANIDNEENRKIDIQNSLQKQLNLLAFTTGNPISKGVSFDFELNTTTVDLLLSEATNNSIDFKLVADKIKQAKADIDITKLHDKPTIAANAGLGFRDGYVPELLKFQFNGLVGVSFNMPLYAGGRTKQQIKLQQTIVKQNELAIETLSNQYKKDIQQTLADIASNIERMNHTIGQIEQAKAAQTLASVRFKNDVGTNLEITNASTNVQRALLNKLQYEYQLCLAKVELARLIGVQYW
jgi:outer membrane protein TolC